MMRHTGSGIAHRPLFRSMSDRPRSFGPATNVRNSKSAKCADLVASSPCCQDHCSQWRMRLGLANADRILLALIGLRRVGVALKSSEGGEGARERGSDREGKGRNRVCTSLCMRTMCAGARGHYLQCSPEKTGAEASSKGKNRVKCIATKVHVPQQRDKKGS